jgi:hypothetical protein
MMQPLFANAGVPMLFVQMPLLLLALPVVIAIEAALCRRWLGVSWKKAWRATAKANVISTVAGFPIMWIALVILQMVVGGGRFPHLREPWFSVYTVTVQAAWLLPIEARLYWMVPTACIVLMIPAFFVTVFIEKRVYGKALGQTRGPMGVAGATWRMHGITYGLLLVVGFWLLGSSLASHKREPAASPLNGGPAGAEGRSGTTEGPPSAS